MDKLSKMRRKPKPPAIETDVDRASSETADSGVSIVQQRPEVQRLPTPETMTKAQSSRPPSTSSGRSTPDLGSKTTITTGGSTTASGDEGHHHPRRPFSLKQLRLRSSGKRSRESPSPAGRTGSASPGPARSDRKILRAMRPRHSPEPEPATSDLRKETSADQGPVMPQFLSLTPGQMDDKFNDLNWDERTRVAVGSDKDGKTNTRWEIYQHSEPDGKNTMDRYVNIKPWAQNRVRLAVPEGDFDYVNASHIVLPSPSDPGRPPLKYIAMQGPTPASIKYVWRMIAEQLPSPAVIVQLTPFIENGIVKCNLYFPDGDADPVWRIHGEDGAWEDGWSADLKYEGREVFNEGAMVRRKFSLHVVGEDEPRTVWHFLYCQWPDFGVLTKTDLASFFELMRLTREHSSPDGPRVVHCSAGVGRTGTFIALEHLIRELDCGGLYDPSDVDGGEEATPHKTPRSLRPDMIMRVVDALRQQRKGMVQTETQYRFIHHVIRDLWDERYGASRDTPPTAEGDGASPAQAADAASADPFTDDSDTDMTGDGGATLHPREDSPTPSASG